VLTPYIDSVTERLLAYLGEHGIEVVSSVGLGLLDHIWKVGYSEVVQAVTSVDAPDADGVFISCTNVPTYDIIGPLERWLGKPVLTANQVTMWSALHAIGSPMMGSGQLLSQVNEPHAARRRGDHDGHRIPVPGLQRGGRVPGDGAPARVVRLGRRAPGRAHVDAGGRAPGGRAAGHRR
jgi:maleate isomerase